MSAACFLALRGVETAGFSRRLSGFVSRVSRLSFGAYLLSWISDGLLYPLLVRMAPTYMQRPPWALPVSILSLALALLLSQLVEWLNIPLDGGVQRLLARLERA